MFDSPIAYCTVARGYVLLDQARHECAREHGCSRMTACPLQRFFVKYCPVRELHVVLDQAHGQCAREHACEGLRCPLRPFFGRSELADAPWPTVPAIHRARRHLPDNLRPT